LNLNKQISKINKNLSQCTSLKGLYFGLSKKSLASSIFKQNSGIHGNKRSGIKAMLQYTKGITALNRIFKQMYCILFEDLSSKSFLFNSIFKTSLSSSRIFKYYRFHSEFLSPKAVNYNPAMLPVLMEAICIGQCR
jgi:hypothetical protein